jgi:hypothetical protein
MSEKIANATGFALANLSQKIDKHGRAHCSSEEPVAADSRRRRA